MKISNSNNSSGSKQDLNQKQQVINFHLNYVDNQLDVVRTVNHLMEANVPHDKIYEILKDNIDEPLTIKQATVDLVSNFTMFGGADLDHLENYLSKMQQGLNEEIDGVILAKRKLRKTA